MVSHNSFVCMLACCVSTLEDTRPRRNVEGKKKACALAGARAQRSQLTEYTKARKVTVIVTEDLGDCSAQWCESSVPAVGDALVFLPAAKVDKSTAGI